MGKSKPKVEVTQYRMSIHFGICHGIPDYISEVKIAEKSAWTGQQATQGSFIIDKPELFGGDKKEGGAVGEVHYFPGNGTQTVSDYLAGKLGLTEETMPAYRGVSSAWFTEYAGARENGFYWSANNPYLPTVWIKVARPSLLLNEHEARIYRSAAVTDPTWNVEITDPGITTVVTDYANDINAGWVVNLAQGSELVAWYRDTGYTERRWMTSVDTSSQSVCIDNLGHVLVARQTEAFVDVYDLFNGDLVQTVTLLAGGGNGMICCTTIGDKAYAFRWGNSVELLQGDADSYAYINSQDVGNWLLTVSGVFLSPHAVYGVRSGLSFIQDGSVEMVPWVRDEDGNALLSAPSIVNLDSLFGIGADIRLIAYSSAVDHIFIVMENGQVHAFSNDLSELLYSNAEDDGWQVAILQSGGVASQYFLTPTVLTFFAQDDTTAQNVIVQYDVATLQLIQVFNIHENGGYVNGGTGMTWGKVDPFLGAILVGGDSGVEKPTLWSLPGSGEYDSNPSHVIFEALQNVEWGMGAPESAIDRSSFEAAATVLYAERLGISFIWTKQSTIETLIREVLDHIEAVLFVSPRTGLITLKLIRDDYSLSGLPEFTPDNSVVTNFARKLWGETINEVVVTFTNPANEETETVVAQDLANIEIQGGPISDSRNYYMLRVKEIAMKLAQRDLRKSSTPLASCDIEVNRTAWDLLPGDVCVLNSPEDGINSIVMRVGPVDYGKPGDSKVRAQLVEDIFSLPTADYTIPPDSEWEDPAEEPTPADETLIFTLPYFFAVNQIDATILESGIAYPEVFAGILAAEEGQDTSEFELYGSETDTTGTVSQGQLGTKSIASYAELSEELVPEVTSTLPTFPGRTQGHGPSVGGFMYIEGTDETDCELCLFTAVSSTAVSFRRGVLDTVPRAWPAGTPVWFVDANMTFEDNEVRSEGETVDYKILIRTSLGLLPVAQAPTVSYTLTDRSWLPLRPADVEVNGDAGFDGAVDCAGVDPIPVTWARRNRETEDAVVLAWTAGDVTPETGQTTTVTLTDLSGNVLHTYSGISGTSQNVDPADFGGEIRGFIRVSSVRDGLTSLQFYAIEVILTADDTLLIEDGEHLLLEDGELLLLEG